MRLYSYIKREKKDASHIFGQLETQVPNQIEKKSKKRLVIIRISKIGNLNIHNFIQAKLPSTKVTSNNPGSRLKLPSLFAC